MVQIVVTHNCERFVRFPSRLLDALLRVPFSGTEWRLLLWVVRQTHGWNRASTPFTWYRIAKELKASRSCIFTEGRRLVQAQVLVATAGRLSIQEDVATWRWAILAAKRACAPANVRRTDRKTFVAASAVARNSERVRPLDGTLSRGDKDIKDITKKQINTVQDHPAGAAAPIPGKYDTFT